MYELLLKNDERKKGRERGREGGRRENERTEKHLSYKWRPKESQSSTIYFGHVKTKTNK